jgi:hypothetical protein
VVHRYLAVLTTAPGRAETTNRMGQRMTFAQVQVSEDEVGTDSTDPSEMERTLEGYIDSHTLSAVVEALAGICIDKANHIRTSYGDRTLAASWCKKARQLRKLATKL